jgi:hypothetical protein
MQGIDLKTVHHFTDGIQLKRTSSARISERATA